MNPLNIFNHKVGSLEMMKQVAAKKMNPGRSSLPTIIVTFLKRGMVAINRETKTLKGNGDGLRSVLYVHKL